MLEKSSTSSLGAGCREFESRHLDQKSGMAFAIPDFCIVERLENQIAICRWHMAATSANTGSYIYFSFPLRERKMQTRLASWRMRSSPLGEYKVRHFDHLIMES